MTGQLILLPGSGDGAGADTPRSGGPGATRRPGAARAGWHLDERTRRVGLRGVAEARRALREAAARADHPAA